MTVIRTTCNKMSVISWCAVHGHIGLFWGKWE